MYENTGAASRNGSIITTYWIAGLAFVLNIAVLTTGCSRQPGGSQKTARKVTGSTTVPPVAQAATDAFGKDHASADIQVTGGGSSGLNLLSPRLQMTEFR